MTNNKIKGSITRTIEALRDAHRNATQLNLGDVEHALAGLIALRDAVPDGLCEANKEFDDFGKGRAHVTRWAVRDAAKLLKEACEDE